MDFRDITKLAMVEYKDHLVKALDGMTPLELSWKPSPNANHALWLAWHIARVEDGWINRYIAESDEIWVSDGWAARLEVDAQGSGAGSTVEDVAAFPEIPIADITNYHDAVRDAAFKVVEGLTEDDLEKTRIDSRRNFSPTIAWVLAHVAVEEAQHVGQIAYLRGMLRGINK